MKQTHAGTASKTLWLEQHRNLKKVCRTKLFFDERVLKNVPTTVGRGVPFSVCRLVTIAIAAKRPSRLTTTGCRHAGGGGAVGGLIKSIIILNTSMILMPQSESLRASFLVFQVICEVKRAGVLTQAEIYRTPSPRHVKGKRILHP